ncbi:hypothetical protein IWW34DRAFT_635119 [Fusarium oxysporum f. sp. albedinis]|nr:hypothetical protein IWW34DRAFT_635119 [Fusarium oxysporum f. sp. albedinis]
MRTIQDLIKQVKAEGFILTKVKPYLANNNTTGFIATETIKVSDVVLQVPYKSAHTTEDISAEIKDKYPDCSAQSYYALEIAKSIRKKERNVWCFLDEVPDKLLRDSIITWPDSLIQALPKQTIRSATDLRAAYKDDWRETESSQKKGGLDIEQEEFKQAWIVAQTRMLACEGSNGEAIQAMLPLAEMFNHASDGCHLDFADNFYEFRATRDYNSGEEVCWNYNPQFTNDDLLSCYGFIEKKNKKDYFILDDFILRESARLPEMPQKPGKGNLLQYSKSGTVELNDIAKKSFCLLAQKDNTTRGNQQLELHPVEFNQFVKTKLRDIEAKTTEEYNKFFREHIKEIERYPIFRERWEEHLLLLEEGIKKY